MIDKLTKRERELVELLSNGKGRKFILDKFVIEYGTLTKYLANIRKKLGVHCDSQIVCYYYNDKINKLKNIIKEKYNVVIK